MHVGVFVCLNAAGADVYAGGMLSEGSLSTYPELLSHQGKVGSPS